MQGIFFLAFKLPNDQECSRKGFMEVSSLQWKTLLVNLSFKMIRLLRG